MPLFRDMESFQHLSTCMHSCYVLGSQGRGEVLRVVRNGFRIVLKFYNTMTAENTDSEAEMAGPLGSSEILTDLCSVQHSIVPSCAAIKKTTLLWILSPTLKNRALPLTRGRAGSLWALGPCKPSSPVPCPHHSGWVSSCVNDTP